MRKLVFGLLGFAALGAGALSTQPAEAQSFYPGYGYQAPFVEHVQYRRYYGPYRPYRAYRPYRPYGFYRPAPVIQRCWIRPQRVWNGFRWVSRPVRVCRY